MDFAYVVWRVEGKFVVFGEIIGVGEVVFALGVHGIIVDSEDIGFYIDFIVLFLNRI